jgi:hypothetical protein
MDAINLPIFEIAYDGASDDGAPSSSPMYNTDPELIAGLARIEQKVDSLLTGSTDHETRLRTLERWRWGIVGAFTALVALFKTGVWTR